MQARRIATVRFLLLATSFHREPPYRTSELARYHFAMALSVIDLPRVSG